MSLDWVPYIIFFIVNLCVTSYYLSYWYKQGSIAGPKFPIPFFGSGFKLLNDANYYWLNQAKLGPISSDILFGKFIVFIKDNSLTKQIFMNQYTGYFKMISDPFNTGLFGENNLMHLTGDRHKFFRQQFLPLFTTQKLDGYFYNQKNIVLKHMNLWNGNNNNAINISQDFKLLIRNLNLETSQRALLGNYPTFEEIKILNTEFPIFNDALFSIPINLPGTQLNYGFKALYKIRHVLEKIVDRALNFWENIKDISNEQEKHINEHDTSMLDFWISNLYLENKTKKEILNIIPLEELAHHTFDQLYAAQDASVRFNIYI